MTIMIIYNVVTTTLYVPHTTINRFDYPTDRFIYFKGDI